MPYYLLQLCYTPEGWAALVRKPENRLEAVRPAVQKLGGDISAGWLSDGQYDVAVILRMPTQVSASAAAMAFRAGGATRSLVVTPLLSWEEGVEAMRKAGEAGYRPPTAVPD